MTTVIRFIKTGKVRPVSNNEAHELIDKGEAELVSATPQTPPQNYMQRQIKAKQIKTK